MSRIPRGNEETAEAQRHPGNNPLSHEDNIGPVGLRAGEEHTERALKFRLDKLERDHPYSKSETHFGNHRGFRRGYCTKGVMAERIAIPIHNAEAAWSHTPVASREPPGDTQNINCPGFSKIARTLQSRRAAKEPKEKLSS